MSSEEQLIIDISVDAGDAHKDLDTTGRKIRDVGEEADHASSRGSKLSGMFDLLGKGALVAGAGVLALGGFLIGATKAAADEQVGIDRLNQTLKNSIPNWEAQKGAVEGQISAMERLAFTDDAARDSLNFLVGQTKDLAEAQELQGLAADLARAKGIDLMAATKAVGKVDQESIGILKKLGVEVTEQMTKEEALAAIRAQTAGQAETYAKSAAGSMERAQNALGNAFETIGGAILPLVSGPLQQLADWLQSPEVQAGLQLLAEKIGEGLAGAFNFLGQVVQTVGPPLMTFFGWIGQALGPVVTAIQGFMSGLQSTGTQVQSSLGGVMGLLQPIFAQMQSLFSSTLGQIWGIVQSVWGLIAGFWQTKGQEIVATVMGWIGQVGGIIQQGMEIAQQIVGTVLGFIQQFFTDHGAEIQGILGMAWDTIKLIIDSAMQIIKDFIMPAFQAIADFISDHSAEIQGVIDGAWTIIKSVIEGAMGIIQGIINLVMGIITLDWERAWNGIKQIAESLWNMIKGVIEGAWKLISDLLKLGLDAVKAIWEGAWNWISKLATDIWNGISKVVTDAWNGIEKFIKDTATNIKNAWDSFWGDVGKKVQEIWDGITGGIKEAWDNVTTFLREAPGKIWNALLQVGKDVINGIVEGLKSAANAVWEWIQGMLGGLVDNVKNFFGIKSPSRLMADEVGKPVAQGIAAGFAEEMPKVSEQIKKLCDDDIVQPIKKLCDQDLPKVLTDEDSGLRGVGGAIADAIGKGFGSTWEGIAAGILAMITQFFDATWGAAQERAQQIKELMEHGTAGSGQGYTGGTGNHAGGGGHREMARGGPVRAGQPYIVGDAGRPELFVPDQDGTILPRVPRSIPALAYAGGVGMGGGNFAPTIMVYVDGVAISPERVSVELQNHVEMTRSRRGRG